MKGKLTMVTNSAVNKPRGGAAQAKPYPPLPVLGVMGALLAVIGVLSFVARYGGMQGAFFTAFRQVLFGLSGCFVPVLAIILLWGGILLIIASKQPAPFRAFLILSAFTLLAMTLINLLSRIGNEGFFVPYCIGYRGDSSYAGVIREAYRFCANHGEPAGALGMLLGYPAYRFLGTVFSTIVIILLMILLVLLLFHFDFGGHLSRAGESIRQRQQEKARLRAQAEEQQRLEEQRRQQEENLRNLRNPAYERRAAANAAVNAAQYAQQPAVGMMPPVQQQNAASSMQPAAQSGTSLYDEVIAPAKQPQEKRGWPALHTKPAKVHQVGMVFTPSECGYTDDASAAEAQPAADRATLVTGGKRKNTTHLEENRRRKTELLDQLRAKAAARQQSAEADKPADPAPAAEEAPTPAASPDSSFFPLVDDDTAYRRPDANEGEEMPKMPDDPTQHTPLFAPLVDMDDGDEPDEEIHEEPRPYVYPPVDLLNLERHSVKDTTAIDQANAQKLEGTLASFNIPAKVQQITHGPAITRFALGLTRSGVNVKKILNVADNISLDLAANGPVRIESQIPGTSLFGIEVPNAEVQMVTFAQVLMSPEMQEAKSPLSVCLGHDITGKPVICDLAKMPHLLIAGQTGSGKSVCVNTIINSLLFRTSPEDVRMIMIDPKVVELQCYNVVPHLLIPVVSDAQKAVGALAWAVAEMEDRYNKMQSKNVRELSAYNEKLGPGEQKLPRIVIIIDELADLMMASKRDVEESIIRIAQKARAAGIHMVVATQRPTVDVITGLIKSNVPSRIAFAVSSNTDSRTILDRPGAERLLGRGDMLYMPTGINAPVRVQGCFLSDSETERVVNYISQYSRVEYDPDALEALEQQDDTSGMMGTGEDEEVDNRLEEAIEIVLEDKQASISMLQRRMKIGYARAGRLIDDMAARGIVSKSLGSKPREVLITREEYDRIKDSLLH